MPNWSKSFETYLNLSDKQRLGIGLKSNEILSKEINNLVEEEMMRPTMYMLVLAPFVSLKEEVRQREYQFVKETTGYGDALDKFIDIINRGKNDKVAEFFQIYFKKLGGESFKAYTSMALALLTIKGELLEEDKQLIEKIYQE